MSAGGADRGEGTGPRPLGDDELGRLFPGESELARRMRSFDWSASDLGPPGRWPVNLRTAVSLCLTSRFPILIWWGPDLNVLYNDAYIPFLGGAKHPSSLGQPGREVWAEIWDTIGPMLEGVRRTAEATWSDDFLFFFERKLPREEVHVRFTYGPILAADGRTVEGVFCPCTEITDEVVGARRLETLRKLGVKSPESRSVSAACAEAARVLSGGPHDIPFAAIYVADEAGDGARLVASAGLSEDHPLPPSASLAAGDATPWPLAAVLRSGRAEEVRDLRRLAGPLPGSPWPEAPSRAMVLPVPAPNHGGPAGLLVLGVSPRRVWDARYRAFFDLVAGHIGTALADAVAYEAERRRAEALAEIDRAKTAFFSNVSHEFRTPLTLMLGPVEDALADADEPLPPGQRERLETAHRSGLRLLRLVNSLLEFSRIEAGRARASYESTDLAALTAELASNFRSACEKAGLRLVVDCPPLPEPVFVDRDMWEKVVLNLVSNAFKFTLEGEVVVRLGPVGGAVELSVRDTGTGIPAGELPRIFERFHRVEGVRGRTHEGTGIGLALIQELVRLHGGSVRAESTLGRGSTFVVSIPLGIAHLPADSVGASRPSAASTVGAAAFVEEALRWLPDEETSRASPTADVASKPSGLDTSFEGGASRRPRILWADDNADLRDYVRRLLEPRYDVEAVPDGEAALAAARASPPDLVLSDVMMPRLDGFGLLGALRADPRTSTIPVILLSARAGEESRVEGLEAGADDYLVKPFGARELLALVGARLDIARVRRESEQRVTRILESITEAFQVLDADWRITYMNPVAREFFRSNGMDPDSMIGKHFWEDLFPEAREGEAARHMFRAMTERVPVAFESYYAPWDMWQRCRFDPLPDGGLANYFQDITDRKRAEEDLRRNEALLAEAQELAHVGSWNWDLTTDLLTWSDEHHRIFGLERQEDPMTSERGISVIHPDDLPRVRRAVDEALREHKPYDCSLRLLRHDGSVRFVHSRGRTVYDHNGEPVRMYGTVQDVTERYQAEEALRQSEARFRNMADNAPVGVWVADPTSSRTYFNEWWYRFTGTTPEQGLRSGWLEALHPDDRGKAEAIFRRANEKREAFRLEYRLRRHDGEYRWAIDSAAPRLGPSGEFLGYIGSVLDVTEEKRKEEALRHSEALLGQAQQMAHMGNWSWDLVSNELVWSDGHYLVLGLQPHEVPMTVERAATYVHPDDSEAAWEALRRAIRDCQPYEWCQRMVREDGTIIIAQSRGQAVYDEVGKPLRVLGTIQDVTEFKRLEAELRRAKEAAEAASRAKDEFLANVSHEIRTPFGAILGMTELVLDTPLTDDQRQCLETVKSAADSLLGLVDDLLDFEKIGADKLELAPADFLLRPMMADALRALGVRAQKKGLELAWDVESDVPDALLGDAVRLRQVLINLVGNAIKFTKHGEVAVRVQVAEGPVPDEEAVLRFTVRDTGIGIPRDAQGRIFRAFEQGDSSTTREYGGTGLGLTIASRLVTLMGGAIGVESEPGRGSTFTFTAPFGQQRHPSEEGGVARPSDSTHEAAASAPAVAPLRILVAEDSEFNSRHLERLLGRRGHAVRVAAAGRQALDLVGEAAFDLLLLDVHMPELDGLQVVQAIRERERETGGHLPVIALTARARPEDRERCLAAGMDDYLSKPVRPAELFAAIERMVSSHGGSRATRSETGDLNELLDSVTLLASCGDDAETLDALSRDFRAFTPALFAEVSAALRERDATRLREAAHKLSGILSAFSTAAAAAASDLEAAADRGDLDEARLLVRRLETMAREQILGLEGLSIETLRRRGKTAGS